ncbi:unnamed protein product [Nesidiocoris tenuis]|uniref:Uncharacterized protein n=1 Tax=Nesidiocoris tenuis TaxID=355587 RepID=A0A6H5FYQ9_9HEMI|nr:unnamed protein product [Nesidiocoris tenuis]
MSDLDDRQISKLRIITFVGMLYTSSPECAHPYEVLHFRADLLTPIRDLLRNRHCTAGMWPDIRASCA